MTGASCSLRETTIDGDRCLVIEDGEIRVSINADHGAHLFELTDLRSGTNLLYEDPRGSRHYRVGAWYELFPNAGPGCVVDGQRISEHGDVQYRRWSWSVRAAGPDQVAVDLATRSEELPFGIRRSVTFAGGGEVRLDETITNLADRPLHYLWGHHITFGAVMMGPGSRVDLGEAEVFAEAAGDPSALYAPGARGPLHALPGRDGGVVDLTAFPDRPFGTMLFADRLARHRCGIWSGELATGVCVDWDGEAFPALWFWATRKSGALSDVVACALEPQASAVHTLSEAIAAGAAPSLDAGASRNAWLRLAVHR
ncbi:DUF4432 family protein [Jiangella sp. DSM 45060]|uniref:DUF4432 family protein n=1 Tax=Jiangella sp. DSM 45060 TaxID=1798224 RepID=UPI00087DB124|nr:DUF4432 family protein [Jiangella sp. DSM 45060]SDT32117.1 Galactose mutarotase [Jiangella sp. DSM 45060]